MAEPGGNLLMRKGDVFSTLEEFKDLVCSHYMHPIVKTEVKTIESAKEALSDETISSISLAGGQISTQFYS